MIEAKYRDYVYDQCHHLRSLHTGIPTRKLLNDAADSIEKLEAECDALRAELEQLYKIKAYFNRETLNDSSI